MLSRCQTDLTRLYDGPTLMPLPSSFHMVVTAPPPTHTRLNTHTHLRASQQPPHPELVPLPPSPHPEPSAYSTSVDLCDSIADRSPIPHTHPPPSTTPSRPDPNLPYRLARYCIRLHSLLPTFSLYRSLLQRDLPQLSCPACLTPATHTQDKPGWRSEAPRRREKFGLQQTVFVVRRTQPHSTTPPSNVKRA